MKWDQMGWKDKPLWVIGGDGAMFDIGFQALSRLFASGMNIKVFVLDTQVYSNTGGQASTASFTGQNTKMSVHGKAVFGKQERRKEIAQIAMMHPRTYVAQTTCDHINHFYKSVLGALEFDGPAIVVVTPPASPSTASPTTWLANKHAWRSIPGLPNHDLRSTGRRHHQEAAFPHGQPKHEGRLVHPPQDKPGGHVHRLRPQRRSFVKHFDKDGNPSETMLAAKQDRLENWHLLQELAGLR